MDNKTFAAELETRTKRFAALVIKLSTQLPNSPEGKVIRNQITKSGTSIGANYREANRARSRADFINKIKICEAEASETCYWLDIIDAVEWLAKHQLTEISDESNQLLGLFASIGTKYK
jgi:four helix bundle protein